MSVLIVVAHPDDEVLGCGGTAAALAARGVPVRSCILSGEAAARRGRPEITQLHADMQRAQATLGLSPAIVGDFPNIKFNTVAHLDLVQFVEAAIVESSAEVILTHHPSDLNDDHLHTSRACQAAARLFQRRSDVPQLRALYFIEIPSSSEWRFGHASAQFTPDTFCHIGETLLEKKLEALRCYSGVMRPYPHPRSDEAIRGLSALRGSQGGVAYAEAFETAFRRFEASDFCSVAE